MQTFSDAEVDQIALTALISSVPEFVVTASDESGVIAAFTARDVSDASAIQEIKEWYYALGHSPELVNSWLWTARPA